MMRLPSSCLLLLAVAALATGVACASKGGPPHAEIARAELWKRFTALPDERALAIAGDPERVWVGAAVGGHASREEAERGALEACQQRRIAGRLRAPCRLYAVGDEIVWTTPW